MQYGLHRLVNLLDGECPPLLHLHVLRQHQLLAEALRLVEALLAVEGRLHLHHLPRGLLRQLLDVLNQLLVLLIGGHAVDPVRVQRLAVPGVGHGLVAEPAEDGAEGPRIQRVLHEAAVDTAGDEGGHLSQAAGRLALLRVAAQVAHRQLQVPFGEDVGLVPAHVFEAGSFVGQRMEEGDGQGHSLPDILGGLIGEFRGLFCSESPEQAELDVLGLLKGDLDAVLNDGDGELLGDLGRHEEPEVDMGQVLVQSLTDILQPNTFSVAKDAIGCNLNVKEHVN